MTASPWVTATEAARILNTSRVSIYRRIESGAIPAHAVYPREKGQTVLIKRAFLDSPSNVTTFPVGLSQSDISRIALAVIEALDARDRQEAVA